MVNYSKKQINPLVEKFNIDVENNMYFQSIICMFPEQTNYQIWAIKAVFGGIATMEQIQQIKAWAETNHTKIKSLTKGNIVSYKTKTDFHTIRKEMNGLDKLTFVNDCINRFNTDQKNLLHENILEGINNGLEADNSRTITTWFGIFRQMITLVKHRQEKLISTSSALRDINDLKRHIENALKASYSWDKEDMLSFMARNCNDCKVLFNEGDIVVASIGSFKSSQALCGGGRTGWCLTREASYFRRYVEEPTNAVQYFLFDFGKREDHELAHIGFTVQAEYGITNAHSTTNQSLTGSGARINGEQINIDKALKMAGVPKSVFIRLKDLKNYEWNIDRFLEWVNNHQNDVAMCVIEDNRVVVNAITSRGLDMLLNHTLVGYRDYSVNSKTKNYVILDFNQDVNSDKSIISLYFTKDQYETDKLAKMTDAFNVSLKDDNYLSTIHMPINKFLAREEINPKILIHKLIDERNEEDAVKLLENNPDLDVNYCFNNRMPIFSAIDRKMFGIFKALVNHKNFDASMQNSYGEALLQSLLYDYNVDGNSDSDNNNIKKMINLILDSENYDLNALNLNDDPALNVACEKPSLLWVVEKLVKNPKINVNIINDFNCSSLTNALRRGNVEAAKLLGKRPDLVVREEDREVAASKGINLNDIIKPQPFEDGTSETNNEVIVSTSDFAKLFEQALSMGK